jgi:hypothetical protein
MIAPGAPAPGLWWLKKPDVGEEGQVNATRAPPPKGIARAALEDFAGTRFGAGCGSLPIEGPCTR